MKGIFAAPKDLHIALPSNLCFLFSFENTSSCAQFILPPNAGRAHFLLLFSKQIAATCFWQRTGLHKICIFVHYNDVRETQSSEIDVLIHATEGAKMNGNAKPFFI